MPLAESHIAALSHSGMALDLYAWLAQRLHRVPVGKPAFITWPIVHAQFGGEIAGIRNFRRMFRVALKQVLELYKAALIDVDDRGLTLHHSKPVVLPRLSVVVDNPVET